MRTVADVGAFVAIEYRVILAAEVATASPTAFGYGFLGFEPTHIERIGVMA